MITPPTKSPHSLFALRDVIFGVLALFLLISSLGSAQEECRLDDQQTLRDLRCWTGDKPLALSGSWQVLPGQAPLEITEALLNDPDWEVWPLTTRWSDMNIEARNNQLTYRLDLNFGKARTDLYLFPGEGASNLRVLVRNAQGQFETVFSNIDPEGFAQFEMGSIGERLVALPPLAAQTQVILQVSNGGYAEGIVFRPPQIGQHKALLTHLDSGVFWGALAAGGFFVLALVNISLWLARRQDRSQLYLGLLFLFMAIRLFDTARLINVVFPEAEVIWFLRIGWYTLFGMLITWPLFFQAAFPAYSPRFFTRFSVSTTASAAIICLFSDDSMLQELGEWIRILALIVVVISLYGAGKLIKHSQQHRLTLTLGAIILPVCAMADMLAQIYGYYLNSTNFGFFVFGLLLTAYMNRSYIHALNESEALAKDLELRVEERTKDLHNANEKLTLLASTDGLTGLANRRALDERFEQERKSAKRVGQELCLALVDADFFKKINDSYGHDVGDKVLIHLANTMINELRESDLVARIGGEEFVVLLPTRNLAGGVTKLNRVRESIAQSSIPFGDEVISVSVSMGVTKVVPEDDLRSALKRADNALYIAKEKGRNRLEGIELLA